MAWYTEGQVTIVKGATSVTGINTKFASNARVGDAFRGPDGLWYEVVNIASETTLGILPAYLGANVTANAGFTIAPMQGYVKESADRLRALTNQYGATLALLGTASNVAALRTNIGAAKSGANGDITSLTGITTPLGTTMGGTGSNTAAGARTALGIGEAGRLNYSSGFLITDTTRPFNDQDVVRVTDAVFAARARSGLYATSTAGINIDTVPPGWCGLVTSTGSNNTGTFPSFASSGFFYLMTQGTYVGSASTQIALRYGANSTSGTNLNPTMAIRTRNTPGTAWGPWGIVQTDQDLTASRSDSTIGKILKVEDFGIGARTGGLFLADIDDVTLGNGWYAIGAGTTSGTKPTGQTYGVLQVSGRNNLSGNSGRIQQIFYSSDLAIPRQWVRSYYLGVWSSWYLSYTQGNINGTVSGTYANPTGALIERGGNANGNYVKYADGTMICWRNMSDTVAIATSLLGGYRSDNITWTYPVPFVESPTVQACVRASAFSMYAAPSAAVGGVFTEAIYNYVTVTTSASFVRYGSVMAIGRWAA